jgi:peptide deformylase
MAVLSILTVPDPVLTRKARAVLPEEFGPALARLVSDMAQTMYAAPGVGLAAPQVGDSRRFLVADPGADGKDGKPRRGEDYLVLVNPVLLETSTETTVTEEGCLSVPDFWEDIERPLRARVRWQDENGDFFERWFEGYEAVVVQHEMDHLDGVLIIDHVSRFKRVRYLKSLKSRRTPKEAVAGA